MDVLGRHRIAFNNIGVQLFGELERDLESALKKGAEEKAELERLVIDQKKLLEERDTRVQQAAKIREQKKRIDELNLELAKALVENERLEEIINPRKPDKETQRTTLGASLEKYLQNKENIPPVFNYLAPGASRTPTPNRPISPPPKPLRKPSMQLGFSNDRGVQTGLLHQKDGEAQTDSDLVPGDLSEAYYDLATRYDVLRDELKTYKGAHEELQEKYLKNKNVWEAWTKADTERREQLKKRRRDESIMSEARGRQIVHGHTTPARSIAGQSPYSRLPPTLSPNKPVFKSPIFHTIIEKPRLSASFRGLAKTSASSVNVGIPTSTRGVSTKDVTVSEERVASGSEDSGNTSWPSSVPGTPEFPAAIANTKNVSQENPKSSLAPNTMEDITYTTDDESSGSRSSILSPTAKSSSRSRLGEKGSSVLPPHPDPIFKAPKVKKEKLDAKLTLSGDSAARPVIKSEPSVTSSEGFGYRLFEEETLDLDDIGYKPDTPRKRRKTREFPVEKPTSSGTSGRVGWVNGGFTIKRAPGVDETQHPDEAVIEETQDEDEGLMFNEEKSVSSHLVMNPEELGGIRTDSQLAIPQTPPRVASAIPITATKREPNTASMKKGTDKVAEDKENLPGSGETKVGPPSLGNWFMSAPNQLPNPVPTPEELVSHKPSPQKLRARRYISFSNAIANITEDGTDGIEDVGSDDEFFPHPPMVLTGKQQKRLEGTARLSVILNSPAPKTPSLAHLKKKVDVSKSVPAKKSLGKTFENISSSEPPKRKAWIDPMRYTKGEHPKQGSRDPSKLDISHFRINPDTNEGRDYAFAETVRSRDARKCLPGCVKTCCKELAGFIDAAGLPPPAPRGPRWRSSSPPAPFEKIRKRGEEEPLNKRFIEEFGKHRDAFARRRSPPGFWDADFPDTQDIIKQNEAANEMRMQKVEEMRREAAKGRKGRYIYKDQ